MTKQESSLLKALTRAHSDRPTGPPCGLKLKTRLSWLPANGLQERKTHGHPTTVTTLLLDLRKTFFLSLASIKEPKAVGALLRDIDAYTGNLIVRDALRMAPYVFVRPGELRQAEWAEFDFAKAEWRIPAAKMKK
ncbi:MAG: hypothetical protein FWG75_07535 [Cystobacterineae bacterium]|nr:hypothetical protein [Cystobacterineae bacterium]